MADLKAIDVCPPFDVIEEHEARGLAFSVSARGMRLIRAELLKGKPQTYEQGLDQGPAIGLGVSYEEGLSRELLALREVAEAARKVLPAFKSFYQTTPQIDALQDLWKALENVPSKTDG